MAGGGCRLLPFLCRGDPVAIAANLERHHPRRGNADPSRPGCRGRSGEGGSGCPRYHRARPSPPAHPGRPRHRRHRTRPRRRARTRLSRRPHHREWLRRPRKRAVRRRRQRRPPLPYSRQPPCRPQRRLLRIRNRCPPSLRRLPTPSAQPGESQEWAPRTEKARRPPKEGEKAVAKAAGGEGKLQGRTSRTCPRKYRGTHPRSRTKDVLPWGFSND